MTVAEKRKAFKDMIFNGDHMPLLCGAYDGITARLAEILGFDGCIMGGQAVAAVLAGVPDIGLITATEQIAHAHRVSQCIDIPMLADADTGYGNVLNVRRTLRDLEDAGLCGAHWEDQVTPKRCGAMGGIQVESAEVHVQKIETLVKYRRDPNFLIIGRTDAGAVYGLDEAIRRAKLYYEAGADIVMYGGIFEELDDLKRFVDGTGAPVLHVLMETCEKACFKVSEVEAAGVSVCVWPNGQLMRQFKAMYDFMKHFKETGDTHLHWNELIPIDQCNKMLDIMDWNPPGMKF